MKASKVLSGILAVLAIVAIATFLYFRTMTPKLELGLGYAARVACGCRYIEGRPLRSCYRDFEPGMEPIRLSDDPATHTVTASVPLLLHRKARFDPVLGCQPDRFKGEPLKVHPSG
ncbi:MAG: hypothetical protein CMN72_10885 [Sphingomonas sp.]|nr:hypothetical protein [Sphingomonas sp.]